MKSAMLLHLHSCQTHNDRLSVYQSQSIRSLLVQIVQIPQDLSLWRNHFIAIRSQVLSNKCNSSDFSIKEYANLKCNFYIMKIIFIDFYFSHGELYHDALHLQWIHFWNHHKSIVCILNIFKYHIATQVPKLIHIFWNKLILFFSRLFQFLMEKIGFR